MQKADMKRQLSLVCPTGLVTQWASEMQEKFHEKFHVILPSDYDTIRRLTDAEDVYGQYDQVISPMDSIKPIEKHAGWTDERVEKYNEERIYSIINSGWDLIIIDEAHRVAGSSGEVARYKLGYLLSQASPYLLLLSATPHNGKTEPFLRLVRLLDEEALFAYQDEVTNTVLNQKLYDEWGERTTLQTTCRRVTLTLKDMGILENETRLRYRLNKQAILNPDVVNFMLSVAMKVEDSGYYPFVGLTDFSMLFPFKYHVTKEQIMECPKFSISNFGGELSVSLSDQQ